MATVVAVSLAVVSAAAAQGRGGRMIAGGQPRGIFGGDQPAQPTGTAKIRGQVLAADTGSPLRRAQVRAAAPELRVSRLISTDAQGRYELKDLPAGRYSITATKGGFVTLSYGQRRPFESGRPLEIADGQSIDRVEFRLPRGSAISGRILDEFGEPVTGARVQVLRYQFFQGQRRLVPAGFAGGGSDSTDDRGEYRLFGLAPGDYYVSAVLRAGMGMGFGGPGGTESADSVAYAPTYFPGTTNTAEAQRIELGVGQEHANATFALSPTRTVKISGTALDAEGKPLGGGFVMLANTVTGPGVRMMMMGGGARVRNDGSFLLTGVAQGEYLLQARTGGGDDAQFASVPLTVGDEDLVGVNVVASRGATAFGTVVMEQGSTGTLRMSGVQVFAQADRFDGPLFGAPPRRVDDDGAFAVTGLTGRRTFRANAPAGWTLKAVLLDGQDITDTPLEFKGAEQISGLQVILTDRVTQVSGSVKDSHGDPTREYTVVIFPDDSQRWQYQSRYIRSARADQDGQFKVRGLPPYDSYLAVAVDYLEDGEGGDPEFLERMRDRAVKLSLADAESKALDLKLTQAR